MAVVKEIEIVKWVVRLTNYKGKDRAKLVGIGEDGDEYEFFYKDIDFNSKHLEIIVTDKSK